jgi:hypothetical protein
VKSLKHIKDWESAVALVNDEEKPIGKFSKSANVFCKIADLHHFMRAEKGWGIDKDYVDKFLLPTNATVIVVDTVNLERYKLKAEVLAKKPNYGNYGHGMQYFVRTVDGHDKLPIIKEYYK